MEGYQKDFIRKNQVSLIENTICNTTLLAILQGKDVLSQEDRQDIETLSKPLEKSAKLYETVQKKTGAYDILAKALEDNKQSGAADILKRITIQATASDVSNIESIVKKLAEEMKIGKEAQQRNDSISFNVRSPVHFFTGREKELEKVHLVITEHNKHTVVSQMASISGLGGIGKTELTRQYITVYKEYFNNIIWIDAEREDNLSSDFVRLAKDKLGLQTKDANGSEKDINSIIEEVYIHITNSSGIWLMVFDNALFNESLQKFLPMRMVNSEGKKCIFVLITSRDSDWPMWAEIVHLNEMKDEEAIQFIRKALPGVNENNPDIKKLVIRLQCFPLALQQAVSYIYNENKKREYTIADYLRDFHENQKQLLNSISYMDMSNKYTKTTYSTLTLTVGWISEKVDGKLALKILHCIAYFAADEIQSEAFLTLANNSQKQLDDAVWLLAKYSMVRQDLSNRSLLTVHRLVQEVIRVQLKEESMEEMVLSDLLGLIFNKTAGFSVEHALSVWEYSCEYQHLVLKYESVPLQLIERLHSDRKFDLAINFAESSYKFFKETRQISEDTLFEIKMKIGIAYVEKGKYVGASGIFKSLLEKIHIDQNHVQCTFKCFQIRYHIAVILNLEGNFTESSNCLTQLITDIKRGNETSSWLYYDCLVRQMRLSVHSGNCSLAFTNIDTIQNSCTKFLEDDNIEKFNLMSNISVMYTDMGNPAKAVEILKDILTKYDGRLAESNKCRCFRNLSVALTRVGNHDEALIYLHKAYDMSITLYGSKHLNTLLVILCLSEVLMRKCFYEMALSLLIPVYETCRKMFGVDSYYTLLCRVAIATTKCRQRDVMTAIPMFKALIEPLEKQLGKQHVLVCHSKLQIALDLESHENYCDALKMLEELKAVEESRKNGSTQLVSPQVLEAIKRVQQHMNSTV